MRRLISIPLSPSAPAVLPVPTPSVTATAVNSYQINLVMSYAPPPPLGVYTLQRAPQPTGPWATIATQVSPTYADAALGAGTTYYYRCAVTTAETQPRTSAFSPLAQATTLSAGLRPPQVTGLAGVVSWSSVVLTWNSSPSATQYLVYRGGVLVGGTSGATTYTDTGLTAATAYQYGVTPANSVGSGPESALLNVMTLAAVAPSVPLAAVATAGTGTVTVTYQAPTDTGGSPITGYYASLAPGGSYARVYGATPQPLTIPGTPGTTYTASVHAFNNVGGGPNAVCAPVMVPNTQVTPPAPAALFVTGQSQNSVSLSWPASTGGPFPIAHYKVYRNGGFYAQVTGTTYTDTNAIGTNQPTLGNGNPDPNTTNAGVAYFYTVSAVDNQGNEGPQIAELTYTVYSNGTWNWPGDYSYNATVNYHDTTGVPVGGVGDIKVTVTAPNGQWQPYTGGNTQLWDLQLGAFDSMTIWLKPTASNQDWSLDLVSRQPSPSGDVFPVKKVKISSYGTITPGVWGNYGMPLSDLSIGVTTFSGTVGAPYGTYTDDSSGDTYHTATLTLGSAGYSGCGVDVGADITGSGVPVGTFVCASLSNSLAGPFTVTGPSVTSSLSLSGPMTSTRTDLYKFSLIDLTGLSNNVYYVDNVSFQGKQPTGSVGGGGGGSNTPAATALAMFSSFRGGPQVVVGQHVQYYEGNTNDETQAYTPITPLYAQTGQLPAIIGVTANWYGTSDPYNVSGGGQPDLNVTQQIITDWCSAAANSHKPQAGAGIVQVNWGSLNPVGNSNNFAQLTSAQLASLVTIGSATYNTFVNSTLQLQTWLLKVVAANPNVVMILRLFAELNGPICWYGVGNTQTDVNNQIKLHQQTFTTLFSGAGSNLRQNVLVVYDANNYSFGGYNYPPDAAWPGSAYADLAAWDAYDQNWTSPLQSGSYAAFSAFGVPLMLCESGIDNGASNPTANTVYTIDNRLTLNWISANAPNIVAYVNWNDNGQYSPNGGTGNASFSITLQNDASALLSDSRVVNLSKLPVF